MDTKKLIEEVLLDLGNNKSLTDVSSKIQIIVRLLGDEKLKSWYTCEFVTGYKDQELPDYRISRARVDQLLTWGLRSTKRLWQFASVIQYQPSLSIRSTLKK